TALANARFASLITTVRRLRARSITSKAVSAIATKAATSSQVCRRCAVTIFGTFPNRRITPTGHATPEPLALIVVSLRLRRPFVIAVRNPYTSVSVPFSSVSVASVNVKQIHSSVRSGNCGSRRLVWRSYEHAGLAYSGLGCTSHYLFRVWFSGAIVPNADVGKRHR